MQLSADSAITSTVMTTSLKSTGINISAHASKSPRSSLDST
uniref:Uncharacterized protein n=1 Tax=Arundo donax TaxID=35708 RepID=A0A0A9A0Z4_ARUDO